jgi:hypothetical protein
LLTRAVPNLKPPLAHARGTESKNHLALKKNSKTFHTDFKT